MNASSSTSLFSLGLSSQEIQAGGLADRLVRAARSAAAVTPYTAFTQGGIRKFAVGSADLKLFRIS